MPAAAPTTGLLERPDGAVVRWERHGAPDGAPAVFLHGGPGSGLAADHVSYFDLDRHLVIGFDQRGCGGSLPAAAEPGALAGNTTAALIADMEALRAAHGIDRWLVVGLSWGSTLGLAYAEAHPDRVTGLALGAVTTTSRREVDWITEDLRHLFPRQWDELAAAAAPAPGERVVEALYRRVTSADPAERDAAAAAWGRWEDTHVSLGPGFRPDPRWSDPAVRLPLATLVLHYWSHAAFLGDAGILEGVDRLHGIPGVLVHGEHDISSGLAVPWDLHRRWPGSRLEVVASEGHVGAVIHARLRAAVAELTPAR